MRQWWEAREPRERRVLVIGTVIVAVVLLYTLLWQPLQKQIGQQQAALAEQRQTLHWMLQSSSEIARLRALQKAPQSSESDRSLIGLLESTAREQGLRDRIARMEPGGNDLVQVSLRDVSFDHAIAWIATLHSRYGIEVGESSFADAGNADKVNATLTLRR